MNSNDKTAVILLVWQSAMITAGLLIGKYLVGPVVYGWLAAHVVKGWNWVLIVW